MATITLCKKVYYIRVINVWSTYCLLPKPLPVVARSFHSAITYYEHPVL